MLGTFALPHRALHGVQRRAWVPLRTHPRIGPASFAHRVRPGSRTFAGKRESGAGTKYVDAPFKEAGSPRRPTMNPFDADQLRASSAMSSSCESARRAAIVSLRRCLSSVTPGSSLLLGAGGGRGDERVSVEHPFCLGTLPRDHFSSLTPFRTTLQSSHT